MLPSPDFIVFLAVLWLAAATPGPGLAAIVATTFEDGDARAFWFCLGVMAGDLVWLFLPLHGLALIALKIPILFMTIKWGGVLYLLVLAVRLWRSSSEQKISAHTCSQSFPIASGLVPIKFSNRTRLFAPECKKPQNC